MYFGPGGIEDADIPPAMGDGIRDLTDEEYAETYADGDGGHPLPPELLDQLDGEMP